jgi:membrane-associated protease RseP (regulator of RpoE activity)
MSRSLSFLTVLVLSLTPLYAQRAEPGGNEEKGPYLGVLFTSVSEALYDQLPQLPRKQGVLVTHVLPDSPAAKADLRKSDILLQYDDHKIRDCDDFANLIRASKPDRKVTLLLLRAGKEATVAVTLTLGPPLKIAEAVPRAVEPLEIPKGVSKPVGPPPLSVTATPLEEGRMKVAIEFLPEGGTRLRTVTCEGSAAEIDTEVGKLPERERDLVRVALKRIRELIPDKNPTKSGPG